MFAILQNHIAHLLEFNFSSKKSINSIPPPSAPLGQMKKLAPHIGKPQEIRDSKPDPPCQLDCFAERNATASKKSTRDSRQTE